MSKEELTEILHNLNSLYDNLLIAKGTTDKRSRNKKIHEAENEIRKYAVCIPNELRIIFDKEIGHNALFGQHPNDISECIKIVERLISEYRTK